LLVEISHFVEKICCSEEFDEDHNIIELLIVGGVVEINNAAEIDDDDC
jgi:hypothetical protein